MEDTPHYSAGSNFPPPTTESLVAQAHANRQGIPYPTGDQLLENLPTLLRALCDFALSGKASTGELAYGMASIIDAIESATVDARSVH